MVKSKMKWFDWTAFILVAVGALNWGLIGFFNFNLVTYLFGTRLLTTIVYDLVGIAGAFAIYTGIKLRNQ